MRQTLTAFIALLVLLAPASAKVRVATQTDLMQWAQVIALIEVTEVAPVNLATQTWTYRQKAQARPVRVLRGKLPATFDLLAQENFECAQTSYQPGRYLVFLKPLESGGYATVGYDQGQFRVQNGQVQWFANKTGTDKVKSGLDKVLTGLTKAIGS